LFFGLAPRNNELFQVNFYLRAAFDFLREQRERKQKEDSEGEGASETEKITFKKPKKRPAENSTNESISPIDSSSQAFGGPSKRILPECVVGSRTTIRTKKSRATASSFDENKDDSEDVVSETETSKKKSKEAPKLSFNFEDE